MHVLELPAHKGFIDLYRGTLRPADLAWAVCVAHRPTDAVEHEPCGFLCDAQRALDLVAGNPVAAVGDHPHSDKPLVEADGRILHDGSDFHGELAFFMSGLALPDSPRRDVSHVVAPTGRTLHNAIRPTPRHHVGDAVVGVREVDDGLLEGFGFGDGLRVHNGYLVRF